VQRSEFKSDLEAFQGTTKWTKSHNMTVISSTSNFQQKLFTVICS